MKRISYILLFLFACSVQANASTNSPFTVFADVLFWEMTEVSDANWSQLITPAGAEQAAVLHDAPFGFDPGFRLGVNYQKPDTAWDVSAYYTYYTTSASDSKYGDIFSPYLGNFFANNTNGANFGPFYDSGHLKWDLSFNSVDIELGRHFKIDRRMNLRPFAGVKAALIKQTIDTDWYGPKTTVGGNIVRINTFTHANEKVENNFIGVGPSAGVDSTWALFESMKQSFNIVANVSGALMWGHWWFSDVYTNNTPVTIKVKNDDIIDVATVARGLMGLEWVREYSSMQLRVHLAYEAQVWFDQVQYYNYNMGKLEYLMTLQGGTLGFSLNY